MEAGAYLPRPVVVSMMLKTHMKRGFWPAAGRIALRASGGWLEDQSLRAVQVAGQLQHALLAVAARQRSTVRAWTCCDYKYRLLRPVDSWREGRIWSG
jgi:hypothetical protein